MDFKGIFSRKTIALFTVWLVVVIFGSCSDLSNKPLSKAEATSSRSVVKTAATNTSNSANTTNTSASTDTPVSNINSTGNMAVSYIDSSGKVIGDRFSLPEGFDRVQVKNGSFAEYLRNLPLKPDGTLVHYYDGKVKSNPGIYDAVIDIDTGDQDLQQCADAVMRLRGEYLYKQKRYNEIFFHFADGFKADYKRWMDGYGIVVKDDRSYWVKRGSPSNTYSGFRKYMDMVFAYANTVSLEGDMKKVKMEDMTIGDVIIDAGHCVIVVDMAEHKNDGKKLFMIAQSYMPAQEIQVLKNPNREEFGPWYELDIPDTLKTPQWVFTREDLRRFK